MKTPLFVSLLFSLFVAGTVSGQTGATYQRPPAILEEMVMAKMSPSVRISRDNQWALQLERSYYPALARLAQPELRIAGTRINPATFSESRVAEYPNATLMHIPTQKEASVSGLPEGSVIVSYDFSPSCNYVVLFVEENDGVYLYSFSFDQPQAKKISPRKVNTTGGATIEWVNEQSFITLLVPQGIGTAPQKPAVPAGPLIQENIGKAQPARTYQDLLTNPYDESLFEYYFTAQLAEVSSNGVKGIGKPAIYSRCAISPNKSYLLATTIQRPYSYQVPMYSFPQKIELRNLEGNVIKVLAENPVVVVAMGYDTSSPYPRGFSWRSDKPATLYWTEAQDKGDPRANPVEYMDIVYQWEVNSDTPKQEVVRTEKRFGGIAWKDDSFALLYQMSRATNHTMTYIFKPCSAEKPQLLFDLSMDDNYNNPGSPVMIRNAYDRDVLYTNKAKTELLFVAQGASSEGDMPYLSSLSLKDKKSTILWRCQAPYYEGIIKVTDPEKLQVITSRQSITEPANLFVRDIKKKKETQLTHFPNPYPAMANVTKEKIQYKRADGLDLTATVYLPAGYNKEKDGRLPVLMWAYPREFRTAADAAQVRGSKYLFTNINYGSPVFWVMRGYCVMDNVEMPIVSTDPKAEPNDNFIEQLTMNAEAAIKVINDMGVGDPNRVAIGGHSYGAFMTANLLTHTKLFKAGLARSGAYNRTLTPFGFQAETRTYWEAPEVYNTMSPFMYANQLNGALLLVHGEMDNNSGTFPLQSERFYNALQGHGGTVRYVVLPYESHGYAARENVLHLLWESDTWLDTYVKNAK